MTAEKERSPGHYAIRFILGLFVVIAVPLGAFAFFISEPMNVSRICTTQEGEMFRLLAFAPDQDPYLDQEALLIDGERNTRDRASVAQCGAPLVIEPDFPSVPTQDAIEAFSKPYSATK